MQAIISARGLSISKTYKDALTRRLSKLEPMLPGVSEARIVLSREKHRRVATLTLIARGHTFRAEETAGELETAIDMAVDALARQVREAKDRSSRKARNAPRRRPIAVPAADPAAPEVIVRRVPLKPMSLAEAVERLQTGSEDFVVFANSATEVVSVLYRRRDGAVGLVEPVA